MGITGVQKRGATPAKHPSKLAGAPRAKAKAPAKLAAAVAPRKISASRVGLNGALYATVGQRETKLAEAAIKSWVVGNGRYVTWSGADGAGLAGNVGQSLRIHDSVTGTQKKLMAGFTDVADVALKTHPSGQQYLFVTLTGSTKKNPAFGPPRVAIVDPQNGQLWGIANATAKVKGDTLTVNRYREEDCVNGQLGKPFRQETYSLSQIFKNVPGTNADFHPIKAAWPFP